MSKHGQKSTSSTPPACREILTALASDPWLQKTAKNIAKSSGLQDDLVAELFVILCQKEPDYIEQADRRGYLRWMVVRIMQTMFHSPRHPFFLTYRHQDPTVPIGSSSDTDEDGEDQALAIPDPEAEIEEALEYYRREAALVMAEKEADPIMTAIWARYRASNSAQEVSRYFDVPHSYIRRQLKAFKDKIRHHYHNTPKI